MPSGGSRFGAIIVISSASRYHRMKRDSGGGGGGGGARLSPHRGVERGSKRHRKLLPTRIKSGAKWKKKLSLQVNQLRMQTEEQDNLFMPELKDLADFRFRSEMIRMMGTEEIRLNDQGWSKLFQQKLLEDYERLLDEQESNLAQTERQRIHRLRVEGLLEVPEEDSAVSRANEPWQIQHRKSLISQLQRKKKALAARRGSRRSGGGVATEDSSEAMKPIFADENSNKSERSLHTLRQEKIYRPSDYDIQTQVARYIRKGMERKEEKKKEEGQEGEKDEEEPHVSLLDEKEPNEEHLAKQRKKRYRKLPPRVARLYEEESIAGLYKIAAELLGSTGEPEPSVGERRITIQA